MYDELIKNLRKMQSHEYCVLVSIDGFPAMQIVKQAADAIEELTREAEEYKAAWCEEHNQRIAENRYLYDELTKAVREKLLMTPMRIVVPQPPKDGEP